jgi:type II secretory pathway predicted ATPase ExeA
MYEEFFGFRERPFDLTPDPRFLVLTHAHSEVLSTLEYGISSRKGITLLTGEAGSGKTTLIRAALAKQPERVHCAMVDNPMLTRAEFVELLGAKFGLSDRARESKTALLVELEALLRDRADRGEATLLVVDEAQSLSLDLLEELRLLVNIETDSTKLLSLVIAGQPELAERLNDPALRQFKQRVALRCALKPLTAAETTWYLAGRVGTAGGTARDVFTREAVAMIHRRSGGVPRLVSVIADNALLGGFAAGVRPVSASIVDEVCRDFDLPDIERAASNGTHPKPVNGHAAPSPFAAALATPSVLDAQAKKDESADRPLFGAFLSKRRWFPFLGN